MTPPPGLHDGVRAALDDNPQHPDQRYQSDGERRDEKRCRDEVFDPPRETDRPNSRGFDRRVEEGGTHVWPALPPIARAIALTMKVSTNSTNPADMYAPVGNGSLNSF